MTTDPAEYPYGPYTAPEGAEIECTLIVKAAPERSKKYGETVCTAAILDDGRLVRIYPVPWEEYAKEGHRKWTRLRVRLSPSDEPASRPESHRKGGPLEAIDSPLLSQKGKTPWADRSRLLKQAVNPGGLQALRDKQGDHKVSLGVVKVKELRSFRITAPLDEIIEQADYRLGPQRTLTGTPIPQGSRIDKIKHVFRFKWFCMGRCCEDEKGGHDTTCEDWELFQSFRKWREDYEDDTKLLEKLKHKYYDTMGQTDLHFIMGTPSNPAHQNSWMIVGIFYPHIKNEIDPNLPTLCASELSPEDVLAVDQSMDALEEASAHLKPKKAKNGQRRLEFT